MRIKLISFMAFFILIFIPVISYSQAGTLDPSFSGDGIAIFNPTTHHEVAQDVAILEDSSIIICGSAIFNTSFDGFLMRILPNGNQDMSFGSNGIVQISYGAETYAYALELLPDGKIVVAGLTYLVYPNSEFFIAKFLPNGTPDVSFNSTGHFIGAYGSDEEYCHAMAVQPDGKYVLAGRTYAGDFSQLLFMRVNANGTLDASFGTNGYTMINASIQDEEIEALTILNNGQIVGAGYGFQGNPMWGEQVFMAKLDANGQPAAGFGSNGVMVPAVFNDISVAYDVYAHNDSIYITGDMWDVNNNIQLFLAKLDPNGNVYSSFGTNGITFISLNVTNYGLSLLKTSDNKVYVCGTTGLGGTGNRDFLVARYLPSGTLDNNFNSTGYTTTPIQPDWDEANGIAIAPNGKVVLAGITSGFSTTGNNDIAVTRYLNDYIPSGLIANFNANPLVVCENGAVQYTDLSFSTDSVVISWNWSFEGGTPATSTSQHPSVIYSNDGTYNVQLIVHDGIYTDTLLRQDYIAVESIPVQAATPAGPAELCGGYNGDFITGSVPYADEYDWEVSPSNAGTLAGNGTTAVFTASTGWTGVCTIRVRATNQCGNGPWSNNAQCEVHHNPILFQLLGDGGFCEGDPGAELLLDGSESGVDYELYLAGNPTGNIVAGTGDTISFGFINTTGLYNVSGYTDHCFEFMVGQSYVHQFDLPEQASMPFGPDQVCDHDSSTYTTEILDDAEVYIWTLTPEEAGEMTTVFDTAHISWNPGFTGMAELSVHGENMCGEGPESEALEIYIFPDPAPVISGPQLVCDNTSEDYETADNPGSFYTWEVTGGVITAGPGTHQITVLWSDPGAGTVTVTEETADGCTVTTEPYNVTIDDCTGADEMKAGNAIIIYPNPVKDILYIELSNNLPLVASISVYTISGKLIKAEQTDAAKNASLSLDVSTLDSGFYIVEIKDGQGLPARRKFIRD